MKPSDLREVYWSHSLEDLRTLVGLRIQYEIAQANQGYENLVLVAQQVFGKAESGDEDVEVIEDFGQLARAFEQMGCPVA